MKKIFLSLCGLALLFSCSNSNTSNTSGSEISGSLQNSKGETIYLEKLGETGPMRVDSVILDEKGEFKLDKFPVTVGFYRLKINEANFAMLVLDSGQKVMVKGDARDLGNTYTTEGSADTKLYAEYSVLAQSQKRRTDSLETVFKTVMLTLKLDSARTDSLSKVLQKPYDDIIASYSDVVAKKISENANSFASVMAIQQLKPENYIETFKALDKGLNQKYPNNKDARSFHSMVQQTEMAIARIEAVKIGKEAPELVLPMPNDKELALSSLRGKVVLIDFWASWCGPCRKEMPNVKRCYEKYKNKGFEILGVSLDEDKDRWLEAIQKEGMTWPQVSDLKHWKSEAVLIYGIQSIPFTVLVDKEGKILATDLRGLELDQKLKEVLK